MQTTNGCRGASLQSNEVPRRGEDRSMTRRSVRIRLHQSGHLSCPGSVPRITSAALHLPPVVPHMPDRPVCVLLPGFDGSGRLFAPLLAEAPLLFDLRVVALPSDTPRDYDELVTWVTAHLPADRPYALLAESFSGPIAIRIASRQPKLLTHLVLVATFVRSPLQPWLAPFGSLARPALFARPPPDYVVRALLAGWDADASLVAALRDAMTSLPPAVAAARAQAALGADEGAALARVTVPTLWLRASADRLLRPGHADDAAALNAAVRVATVDGPHMILQRRPRECIDAIEVFLSARLPGSPS